MTRSLRQLTLAAALVLLPLVAAPTVPTVHAQGPCGVVDEIDFPVDVAQFQIAQGFAVPSSRHDGRFHSGEDWTGARGATYGTPVQAIARGRVTYSAPGGWGRDRGVIIIEHQMPDGSLRYSMYGHIEESPAYAFPPVYSCVERGAVIGVIGRVRPAPHLHLEIRDFGPESPGAGYTYFDPAGQGWYHPSQFIRDVQTTLHPAMRWQANLLDASGARGDVLLSDGTLVTYDAGRLLGVHSNGGVLWRYSLDAEPPPLGVIAYGENVLVAAANGALQLWSASGGGLVETWQLAHALGGPPLLWNDLLIAPLPDGTLVAYGSDRAERWRAPAPPGAEVQATPVLLAALSPGGNLALIGSDGAILGQTALGAAGDLAPTPDGGFYLRGPRDLWHLSPQNTWTRLADAPPVQAGESALFSLADGRFFLYEGRPNRTIYAYGPDGSSIGAARLPDFQGRPTFFTDGGGALLIADGYGYALLIGADSGALCNAVHPLGWRASSAWAGLGGDGLLRLHVADRVIGLDWAAFSAGCR